MKILIRVGIGVSIALNVFVFVVAAYGLLTQEKRFTPKDTPTPILIKIFIRPSP